MNRLLLIAVAAVVASFSIADQAQAQMGANCGGFQGLYANNFWGFDYNRAGFERPPYFALFPPVYYNDQIVRRPMGVSPFAAPPGVTPVEMMQPVEPQHIVNPYYQEKSEGDDQGEKKAGNEMPIANTSDAKT